MKNKTEKKDGGTIRNWQLHHITLSQGMSDEDFLTIFPGALLKPGPMIFTGTVVEDPSGRFSPGWHMRSSYIVNIDRERGIIETVNTIYKVKDEGGDVFGDLGNDVLSIRY
jgi:hypothetical protein